MLTVAKLFWSCGTMRVAEGGYRYADNGKAKDILVMWNCEGKSMLVKVAERG